MTECAGGPKPGWHSSVPVLGPPPPAERTPPSDRERRSPRPARHCRSPAAACAAAQERACAPVQQACAPAHAGPPCSDVSRPGDEDAEEARALVLRQQCELVLESLEAVHSLRAFLARCERVWATEGFRFLVAGVASWCFSYYLSAPLMSMMFPMHANAFFFIWGLWSGLLTATTLPCFILAAVLPLCVAPSTKRALTWIGFAFGATLGYILLRFRVSIMPDNIPADRKMVWQDATYLLNPTFHHGNLSDYL